MVAASGLILVLLIGFSRLYLGVYYPTDIPDSFLMAPLWAGVPKCETTRVALLRPTIRGHYSAARTAEGLKEKQSDLY